MYQGINKILIAIPKTVEINMNSTIYLIGDMMNTFLQMMSVSERAELSI